MKDVDLGDKAIRKALRELASSTVAVGFHEDANAKDGKSVAHIAACHEYGLGKVPQRAFIAPTMDEGQAELVEFMGQLGRALLSKDKKMTVRRVFGLIGEKAKQMVQATLRKKRPEWPPLTEQTKLRKANKGRLRGKKRKSFLAGDGNPLIDTGQMLNAVTWKVEKKGAAAVAGDDSSGPALGAGGATP